MINKIPIVGWILSFIGSASLAIPFWICWSICGIGGTYFEFLPEKWQSIPFWNCIGLFMSVSIIKTVFVPRFVSVIQSTSKGD